MSELTEQTTPVTQEKTESPEDSKNDNSKLSPNQFHPIEVLVDAVEFAQRRGAFTLREAELVAQAVRFMRNNSNNLRSPFTLLRQIAEATAKARTEALEKAQSESKLETIQEETDAATDTGTDAATDPGTDAATDPGTDAATDATTE